MSIKGQGHSLTLVQSHSDSTFSFFFLRNCLTDWSQILCGASMGWGLKVWSDGLGHMTKMAAMPIYGKNLKKIIFSGTKRLMTLKVGMQYWVLEYYQICSNDDPGMTLTFLWHGQIWSLRHPSHNTSSSSPSQYKRTPCALPVALLQDWHLRCYFFSSGGMLLESVVTVPLETFKGELPAHFWTPMQECFDPF